MTNRSSDLAEAQSSLPGPGARQCLGLREMDTKVKVERGLVLFCSCAVQRGVSSREGMGQGMTHVWWIQNAMAYISLSGHVFVRVFFIAAYVCYLLMECRAQEQ